MTTTLRQTAKERPITQPGASALEKYLAQNGRLPPVTLTVKPLDGSSPLSLAAFLSYSFSSSMLVPVDTFNFQFVAPASPIPLPRRIREGDIAVLAANGTTLATGLIDTTEVTVAQDGGESGGIQGRDLMAQLEDHDAVSLTSDILFAQQTSLRGAVSRLIQNTRISKIELRNAPSSTKYLFATEPGETKLAALQRFLEGINCLAWMGPEGQLIVGKPNFNQPRAGRLRLDKTARYSNVLSMKVVRSAALVPNIIVPIWSAQEATVARIPKSSAIRNNALGPSRLYKAGHVLPKTVVVSAPNANTSQGLSELNTLQTAQGQLLPAYALRELARQNVREIQVECVVAGHFNDAGEPFMPDTVYQIDFPQGDVSEEMYLFGVDYSLTEDGGQRTTLQFCRKFCIVAGNRAQ